MYFKIKVAYFIEWNRMHEWAIFDNIDILSTFSIILCGSKFLGNID